MWLTHSPLIPELILNLYFILAALDPAGQPPWGHFPSGPTSRLCLPPAPSPHG